MNVIKYNKLLWERVYTVKVKVTQSCPTLCDSIDCTVHGILQARILEWVAFPFSRGSSQARDRTQVSQSGKHCMIPIIPHSGKGKTVARIKNIRGFFPFASKYFY